MESIESNTETVRESAVEAVPQQCAVATGAACSAACGCSEFHPLTCARDEGPRTACRADPNPFSERWRGDAAVPGGCRLAQPRQRHWCWASRAPHAPRAECQLHAEPNANCGRHDSPLLRCSGSASRLSRLFAPAKPFFALRCPTRTYCMQDTRDAICDEPWSRLLHM